MEKSMEVSDERNKSERRASGFFKKLKGIKNLQIIVVIFIIAVALIIYSTVMTGKSAKSSDSVGVSSVQTSDEQRLSAMLSNLVGAGNVETMITECDGKITGVLVIAEGADDITVRLRLIDATATALGVSKNIVNVFCRK